MALNGCSSGVLATVVAALLLLPVHYYVPEQYTREEPPPAPLDSAAGAWLNGALVLLSPLDLCVILTFLLSEMYKYLCARIQKKLMERRKETQNQQPSASVERLCAWNTQQEELAETRKMVQNAMAELNLLLRQHF